VKVAFVDTGGFFALLSENDVNHKRALGVFRRANAERWSLVTTNIVVFETYALLLNRTGEGRSKAIQFLDHLSASGLRIERATERDESAAIALVRAHDDKSYSLCDALGFVVCERLDISDAIACDVDFRSYGRLNVLL
jgi:predicted nucleic acid-binding protein